MILVVVVVVVEEDFVLEVILSYHRYKFYVIRLVFGSVGIVACLSYFVGLRHNSMHVIYTRRILALSTGYLI